jgi:hypothetical protein
MQHDDKKKVLLSETETTDTKLTREELVVEIRRVTNLNIDDVSKILEIIYLTKHHFAFGENEQLPDTYWPDECAPDGTCLPEKYRHGAVAINHDEGITS